MKHIDTAMMINVVARLTRTKLPHDLAAFGKQRTFVYLAVYMKTPEIRGSSHTTMHRLCVFFVLSFMRIKVQELVALNLLSS